MMKLLSTWWFRLLLCGVAVFLALQLVPYRVDNPPGRDQPQWDSSRTEALASRACYDCHSNRTDVLWFEHVAPVSWYVANHVEEGRSALNFDEWSTSPGEEADEAWEPLEEGEMPPASYHYFGLHGDAKLTKAEVDELIAGLEATIAADPPG